MRRRPAAGFIHAARWRWSVAERKLPGRCGRAVTRVTRSRAIWLWTRNRSEFGTRLRSTGSARPSDPKSRRSLTKRRASGAERVVPMRRTTARRRRLLLPCWICDGKVRDRLRRLLGILLSWCRCIDDFASDAYVQFEVSFHRQFSSAKSITPVAVGSAPRHTARLCNVA